MHTWQLQEAKSRFSELVETAMAKGPQIVTKRGVASVVVLSKTDYDKLKKKKKSLFEVLMETPQGGELDIRRSREYSPAIDLR